MASPGQKRGTCGEIMASFDGHLKCAHCHDKGVGKNLCVRKDYTICKSFTVKQKEQLATPMYKAQKKGT